jgi:hypothetical protein
MKLKEACVKFLVTKAVAYLTRLVADYPPQRPGFEPRSGLVGFVVDKAALVHIFSEYFSFLTKHSSDYPTLFTYHLGPVK